MITRGTDISETYTLIDFGEEICRNLLIDRTTRQNIYWATDSYSDKYGKGYTFFDPITIDKITGPDKDHIIRPRSVKSKEEQNQRAKDKAEVFTPSWICNYQNNLIDEAWFGRTEKLFNHVDPKDPNKWINNEEKIEFPINKTWKDYVADIRLEVTCGEAPYLCNRYDAVTGAYNENVIFRIGLLDRKLRIVSENAKDSKEWILWAKIALRSTYGFEWQGDNLVLARKAVFYTFIEHYISKYGEKKFNQNKSRMMLDVSYIISWNIWQMDGIEFGLPGFIPHKPKPPTSDTLPSLFSDIDLGNIENYDYEPKPHERLCLIKDYFKSVNLKKASLKGGDFNDEDAPVCTFLSILNKKD